MPGKHAHHDALCTCSQMVAQAMQCRKHADGSVTDKVPTGEP